MSEDSVSSCSLGFDPQATADQKLTPLSEDR